MKLEDYISNIIKAKSELSDFLVKEINKMMKEILDNRKFQEIQINFEHEYFEIGCKYDNNEWFWFSCIFHAEIYPDIVKLDELVDLYQQNTTYPQDFKITVDK